jgi:hypothetical protein
MKNVFDKTRSELAAFNAKQRAERQSAPVREDGRLVTPGPGGLIAQRMADKAAAERAAAQKVAVENAAATANNLKAFPILKSFLKRLAFP